MSLSLFRCLVLTAFFGWETGCARADIAAVVDPSVRYQTFEGWGVSLCWWAQVVGGFPDQTRNDYMEKIFDPVNGLGLNIVRYNIGGGEDPANDHLPLRADMKGFEPTAGQWDWDADPGQRWVLQQAKAKGATIFEAFSNSPPYWMTISGSVTGEKNGQNNLAPEREKDFADYLVTVVQHFQDAEGITFRTLEPLNEPNSWWWRQGNKQEGCKFDHAAQARIIQTVGQELADKNLTTRVSAPDENSIGESLASFLSYSPATRDFLLQVNTHSYNSDKRAELFQAASAAHKIIWQSEYGDGDSSGISLSNQILKDMHELRPAAWIYWQAVDGPKWGLLTNNVDGTVSPPQLGKKYWVMANYSRYIRPGSVLINTGDEHSLAALDASENILTVVATNANDQDEKFTCDLSHFDTGRATLTAYRTSATEDLSPLTDLSLTDTHLDAVLPKKSVTTLVLTGVTARP